jgi:cysteinyl-tRNA synthetase
MKWNSPWGQGFPGWHIECTAMSLKYLGNQFDIHGGGIDLKFPHHECEIAQGTALNSVPPVKTWMHTNMLTLNGKKMAKSTGNNILPEELFSGTNKNISEAFSPVITRFFMMQAHYRNQLDISQDALNASKKGYQRLIKGYKFIDNLSSNYIGKSIFDVNEVISKFYFAMNDDFNTPVLIKELFEALKRIKGLSINKDFINKDDLKKLQNTFRVFLFDILGFEVVEDKNDTDEYFNKTVSLLIELRENARKNNDFKKADEIRENLLSIGIILKDNKNGTRFELK